MPEGVMPQLHLLSTDRLWGIDLSANPSAVAPQRSPRCCNLLRATPGRVEKRPGFEQIAAYPGAVHGCWMLQGVQLLHAGDTLYADGQAIEGTLADARSTGAVLGGRLYLLDGREFWQVSCEQGVWQMRPVSQTAYLPHIAVGKAPDGAGGTELEDVNLLCDSWCESFYPDGTSADYQLEFGGLSAAPVQVRQTLAGAAGTTQRTLEEGVHFTVDRAGGVVHFLTPPAKGPIEGEDSLFITAARDRSALRSRITQADVCFVYGTPGLGMRLFVTGAGQWPNRDFWSAGDDPTYFSDLSYSVLGAEDGRIMGYSQLGDSLAAWKSSEGGPVWVRTPSIETFTDALGNQRRTLAFRTGSVIAGHGAAAKGSFAVLGDEPLCLCPQGVFALTPSDVTGLRYQQRRSYYIDPALCAEEGLAAAEAVVWNDLYLLALNGRVYCLDGLQKSYAGAAPKSAYQYECYLLTDIPAVRLWVHEGRLYFGTADGRVCRFGTGEGAHDYTDRLEGMVPRAICAVWETPDVEGSHFYRDKNFRWLAARIQPAPVTSVQLYARREGVWRALRARPLQARYFSFGRLTFSKLVFSGDATCKPVGVRLHRYRLDKVRFRFENAEPDEPFGMLGWALEYTEGRRYRR